jgi:hypothetical protein
MSQRQPRGAEGPPPRLVLSVEQCSRLLDKLCVRMGFCIPPLERERLVDNPPAEVLAFTDAVFVAEGMDPAMATRQLYRQVRDLVREAFDSAEERAIQEALRSGGLRDLGG